MLMKSVIGVVAVLALVLGGAALVHHNGCPFSCNEAAPTESTDAAPPCCAPPSCCQESETTETDSAACPHCDGPKKASCCEGGEETSAAKK